MNKDLKKIIKEIECYQNEEVCMIILSQKENKALLDYITNLQQLEQDHKETNATLMSELAKLEEENERLKQENKHIFSKVNDDELLISNAMNYAEAQDYKSRCEKAIEYNKDIVDNYLEEDNCEYCDGRYATAKHNLNILQNEIKGE